MRVVYSVSYAARAGGRARGHADGEPSTLGLVWEGADEARTTVDFVMLDTTLLCGQPRKRPGRDAPAHWRWAEEALLASDANFLVVGAHYPVHSPSGHGPTRCLRKRLVPLLKRCGASVYFSGHDHANFHIGPLADPTATHYHGVGAGMATSRSGKHLRTVPPGELRFFRRREGHRLNGMMQGGFAGVSVSSQGLTVTHYDEMAKVLHQHTVTPRSTSTTRTSSASSSGTSSGKEQMAAAGAAARHESSTCTIEEQQA